MSHIEKLNHALQTLEPARIKKAIVAIADKAAKHLHPLLIHDGEVVEPGPESLALLESHSAKSPPVSAEELTAFVVEIDGMPQIVSRNAGLKLAAVSMEMEVYDPMPVEDADGTVGWEVWFTAPGQEAVRLCRMDSEVAAAQAADQALDSIVGSMLYPVTDWATAQRLRADWLVDPDAAPAKRKPTKGHVEQRPLHPTWKAAGVYTWHCGEPPASELMKRAAVIAVLDQPHNARVEIRKGRAPIVDVTIAWFEGEGFCNFHDLIQVARRGVYLPDIKPWPDFRANRYVIGREFERFMRSIGWRKLWWREEPPAGALHLHGQVWIRAAPIAE